MRISYSILIILAISCSCAFTADAETKKERRVGISSRLPTISITDAIQLALDHHQKANPQGEEVFVDEAVYVRDTAESYWKVGLRQKKHETGHLYYKVTSTKEVSTHSVVKDG